MTNRPILFRGAMVRAILDGRKTQTRRVIKPARHASLFDGTWSDSYVLDPGNASWRQDEIRMAVGDRLWVREAHHRTNDCHDNHLVGFDGADDPSFGEPFRREIESVGSVTFFRHSLGGWGGRTSRNYPGIHMPRWASRLTLTVSDVRAQRLQDISEADAIAEGIEPEEGYWRDYLMPATQICTNPVDSFCTLWTSINGTGSWTANPWVAAYTFTVARRNIDAMEAA